MSWLEESRRIRERASNPARHNLLAYLRATLPDYVHGRHTAEMCEHLEAVERGETPRLMIVEPPGVGKSTVAMRYIAWSLGRRPDRRIIHASYADHLVSGFGRRIRNIMEGEEHLDVFPESRISRDSRASGRFDLVRGGSYYAAGVGGGITGKRADLLVLDDLTKGAADADSETRRNLVWDWYMADARTRLTPDAAVVAIGTRWHLDDLQGRLLRQQVEGGDQWTVLHHPAVGAEGEALWPEMYPLEVLEQTRRSVLPRVWNCLYQGHPAPSEGTYFERSWFRYGTPPPRDHMVCYGASDFAVTEGGGDYTVHLMCGMDTDNRLWVLDMWRRQASSDQWAAPLIGMMQRWKPSIWLTEAGPIHKAAWPLVAVAMRSHGVKCRVEAMPSIVNKPARARAIQARMGINGLWLPTGALWTAELESELLAFPVRGVDDIVDTLSLIGRLLLKAAPMPDTTLKRKQPTVEELFAANERTAVSARGW